MTRRRRSEAKPQYNPNWVFALEYQLSPRVKLVPGTKFKVSGKEGHGEIFTFVRYVQNTARGTDWVDCINIDTREFHSFRPERITRRIK